MSDYLPEHRSINLLARSACIALLIAISYGLQVFNTAQRAEVAEAPSRLFPEFSLPDAGPKLSVSNAELNPVDRRFKDGDIVFRAGNTWLTHLAEQFASDVTYTHVGMIRIDGDQFNVIHASIEGNSLTETFGNQVVEEPLADFLQKGNATHAAIYRLKESIPTQTIPTKATGKAVAIAQAAKAAEATATDAVTAAKTYVKKATPFDSGFDLTTDERVYCTELIWRVYLESGIDLADQGLESFSFPFSGEYLTPDSLAESVNLQRVYQFSEIRAAQSSEPALVTLWSAVSLSFRPNDVGQ